MPRNIIVVGTPRSGTSLAASIFARLGHFVADDEAAQLRDPDHFNPGGYWEAEPLIEANASLFQRALDRDDQFAASGCFVAKLRDPHL